MASRGEHIVLHSAQPTELTTVDNDMRMGQSLLFRCDSATIYIGGQDVDVSTGYPVPATQPVALNDVMDKVYAIVAPANDGAVLFMFRGGI